MKKIYATVDEAKAHLISVLTERGYCDIKTHFTRKEESLRTIAFYFEVSYRLSADSRVNTVNAAKIVVFNKESGEFHITG